MKEFRVIALTRERLHSGLRDAYEFGKLLLLEGRRVVLVVMELEDSLTIRQRGFFHKAVLGQISEQVVVDGRRYDKEIWKTHLKNRILERNPRWKEIHLPGAPEPFLVRMWWSTEELGVKAYSEFIDESIAVAASEWNVDFHFWPNERDAARYTPPRRKPAPELEPAPC